VAAAAHTSNCKIIRDLKEIFSFFSEFQFFLTSRDGSFVYNYFTPSFSLKGSKSISQTEQNDGISHME
jgi:hypothetical protein